VAELTSIARPYAKAAFRFSSSHGSFDAWSEMLDGASAAIENADVQKLISDPRVTREQLGEVMLEICGDKLDQSGRNFIYLLVENRRLLLLPEIAALFSAQRREAEKEVAVEVTAAQPLAAAQVELLQSALAKQLNRSITITTKTNEDLIGGAVIRFGDQVVDGSIRSRLARLSATLIK